jgi:hypothetical protein
LPHVCDSTAYSGMSEAYSTSSKFEVLIRRILIVNAVRLKGLVGSQRELTVRLPRQTTAVIDHPVSTLVGCFMRAASWFC